MNYAPDDFPGADHVPWQLLIRARYAFEVDAIIASHVVNRVGPLLSAKGAVRVAEAALEVRADDEKATPEGIVSALTAIADFDDWCPTYPKRWPPKKRGLFDELTDPIAELHLDRARDLLSAGSPALQETLGGALAEVSRGAR